MQIRKCLRSEILGPFGKADPKSSIAVRFILGCGLALSILGLLLEWVQGGLRGDCGPELRSQKLQFRPILARKAMRRRPTEPIDLMLGVFMVRVLHLLSAGVVLAAAIDSGDAKAVDVAARMIERLGIAGNLRYRELLKKP